MDAQPYTRSRWARFSLAMILALFLTLFTSPVRACACGGYFPREGQASVNQEHVLIRWDGKTEDIVLTLGVLGSSKEAALVFPVPARATVKLADSKLFETLRELTRPRVETIYEFGPGFGGVGDAASGAPPVTLLERQELGPFDVSTLAATDANALGDWLAANGYQLAPEIAAALEPYVAQGWYYVAVRLSPAASESELSGELAPLWITFDHDKIIYPMRLSALARNGLSVYLYVLAEHRVVKMQRFGQEVTEFADWVDPTTLEKDSPLLPLLPKKLFLTKISEYLYDPANITDDYTFTFAANDETYRRVEYRRQDISGLVFLACLATLCLGGFAAIVGIFTWLRRKQAI